MRRAALSMVLAVMVAITTAVSPVWPAHAIGVSKLGADGATTVQNGVFRISHAYLDSDLNTFCLTDGDEGQVRVARCTDNNNYQRWEIWFGGWTRNVHTRQCLTLKPGHWLNTEGCVSGNRYQEWKQWSGGWFQNHFDQVCITYDGWPTFHEFETVRPCVWGWTIQHWFLVDW